MKDYVDTTGNIMVDIADGIGMVSKGIEALEFWLEPGGETNDPAETEQPADLPAPSPSTESAPASQQEPDPAQPKVFCQKGKCYPYDPAKLRNSNINLEMKPGMILTPAQGPPGPPPGQEQLQKGKHDQNRRHRKQHQEKQEQEEGLDPRSKTRGDSSPL